MNIEETYRFATENRDNDTDRLMLKSKIYPDIDMRLAVTQILSRRAVKEKLPTWYANNELRYPTKLSTEQASSEVTAIYKAKLIKGNHICDLTGGLGIDSWAFSKVVERVDYYERYEEYCKAASHNFKTLGCDNITIHNCDLRDSLPQIQTDTIYIDPARRGERAQRLFSLQEYEPNIIELKESLLRASSMLMVKVSPMADISAICREIPEIYEIHIVSVKNECKELLLLAQNEKADDLKLVTINFDSNSIGAKYQRVEFLKSSEQSATINIATGLEEYLYEPNSSIMKSGAFKSLAAQYGIAQIGRNSNLFTSSKHISDFPGRTFRIVQTIPFTSKWLKKAGKEYVKANIAVRNFPLSVAEIRKTSKIGEGGEIYLFATTVADSKLIIECRKE